MIVSVGDVRDKCTMPKEGYCGSQVCIAANYYEAWLANRACEIIDFWTIQLDLYNLIRKKAFIDDTQLYLGES